MWVVVFLCILMYIFSHACICVCVCVCVCFCVCVRGFTVVVCPSIGSFSLEHGRWRIVNGSHYEYRTKIIFTCDPGYYRLGPASIQCLTTGAWSWKNDRPRCESECSLTLSGIHYTGTERTGSEQEKIHLIHIIFAEV